ncbi:uncharacterized protein LOC131020357 isoform X3 [Salvia miltiorrhiza]|uniref:uncharacterized protein LOC131020357 isoform X3 n=1 Tax=Salvia miltiorrhiza TaxID=226208 RepID=UPI0025AD31C0|nr:uncharacterized protein LOC131020357 isoform X3 [Salvia miltiorrhiza]
MECCDICGDVGVADALINCSLCKRNTEHMYCMRIPLEEHVNDWHCEECSMSNSPTSRLLDASKINSSEVRKGGELPAESRKLPNESRVGMGDWEKSVATGKTKYISVQEAIKLSSGEKLPFLSSSNPCLSKTPRRKSGMGKFDSTTRHRKIMPDFSSHQNLASGPSWPTMPRKPANLEIRKKQKLQQSKITAGFGSPNSLQPSEALKDAHLVKEQLSKVQLPVTTRSVKQSSLPSVNTSPVSISGGDGRNNAIDRSTSGAENTSKIHSLDSAKYLLVPALDALWKGSFRILGDHAQKEINHLVQAYPPSPVRKKIYEFSKKMPKVLCFELVSSKPFWNNLFNEHIPDRSDIGLYFFPGVGESSEEDYVFLVDQIISTNYALRKQTADVELLVFSSKLLHANCQCWDGKYFLWGVFRRVKRNATTCSDNTVLDSTVQPSDGVNHDQSQVHDSNEVDMDIDMVGGINVGRVDVPVKKEPRAAMALPESALQVASGLRVAPVAMIPSPNVKVESHDLIPPGFEEVYRLRIQSLSTPMVDIGNQGVGKGR